MLAGQPAADCVADDADRVDSDRDDQRDLLVLLVASKYATLCVLAVAGDDHDDIDQSPDATAAESEELGKTEADLVGVKTISAEVAKEEREQPRDDELLVAFTARLS